jgi:glucose-6-phosphate 1-dehydrogenase
MTATTTSSDDIGIIEPSMLAILGATGDLATRYLLPALGRLHALGLLPEQMAILGIGTRDWNDESFSAHALDALRRDHVTVEMGDTQRFCGRLRYLRADVTDSMELRSALGPPAGRGCGPVAAYLALPHALFLATASALAQARLPPNSRVMVEKPFGQGQQDARRLNALVQQVVPEQQIFRVDHFLAKQTMLNLLGLRFANRVLEPVWNGQHVQRVDITWDETLALEGRAGYYDRAGALKDILQDHPLHLLCLVAMEPPSSLHERDLRDRKLDVLRAVRSLATADVATATVRGLYNSGALAGKPVPSYTQESGVDPARHTETFAAVTLHVDNWRWAGVPFTLRSGKALARNRHEIRLQFRPVPHLPFAALQTHSANELRRAFGPDTVALAVNVNGIGDPFELQVAQLGMSLPPSDLPPYAQVLLAALGGDATLSIRGDEAEESWRIIDPILAAWRDGDPPLLDYAAGSQGPGESPKPSPVCTPQEELAW